MISACNYLSLLPRSNILRDDRKSLEEELADASARCDEASSWLRKLNPILGFRINLRSLGRWLTSAASPAPPPSPPPSSCPTRP